MRRKPILCSPDVCTGCEACKNSCPESCISMQQDHEGFLQPHIDTDHCKQCGICEKSCPIISKTKTRSFANPDVYACWHNNTTIRNRSSSGGVFPAVAAAVISNKGVVYGAAYSHGLQVQHLRIESHQELTKLQGSKYVQSEIGNSLTRIKEDLKNNRYVFFTGTPCQVAGLNSFLGKEYSNLLTADFICHGVPSPLVFTKYITDLEKQFETTFTNFNFRDKRHGWENNTVIGESGESNEFHIKGKRNSYYHAFIKGILLRKTCYTCPFIGLPRVGNITFADFWGIQQDSQITQNEIDKGISLLLLNHPIKSEQFFSLTKDQLTIIKRTIEEAKAGNSPMFIPASYPLERDFFFKDLPNQTYEHLSKRYLTPPLKKRVVQYFKEHFPTKTLAILRRIKNSLTR